MIGDFYMSSNTATKPSNRLNIILWVAQVLLAAVYAMAGFMKVSQPIEKLATSMSFVNFVPESLVRFIGVSELAGALGLILPTATKIMPRLTILAAACLVLLQVLAMIFHVTHGEPQILPVNLVLLAIPAFIVWGRWFKKA